MSKKPNAGHESSDGEHYHDDDHEERHQPVFQFDDDDHDTPSAPFSPVTENNSPDMTPKMAYLQPPTQTFQKMKIQDQSALGHHHRLSITEDNHDDEQVLELHDYTSKEALATEAGNAKVTLEDFTLLRVIGKGAYGKVFLIRKNDRMGHATSADTIKTSAQVTTPAENDEDSTPTEISPSTRPSPPTFYAMKVLKKASLVLHGKDTEHTRNERSILEAVRHPFIVKLHYAFQTPHKLYLILSYASGGELFTHLAHERMFSEDTACFYISELLLALEHLHNIGIIYRDLKPENVLLDAEGHVVLTDFGLSKVAVDAHTVCGTVEFMAPEVVDEKLPYSKAVDYWSLGVMLFDMITGSPPFTGNNRKKIMEGIVKKKPQFPKFITSYAKDLCTKLLKKNPDQRLGSGPTGAAEIKKHSFFKKINWEKLLERDVTPPHIPPLNAPDDTSNFLDQYTKMPLDSPPSTNEGHLRSSHSERFLGFSYVAEHEFSS